jgi:hypothetical protein
MSIQPPYDSLIMAAGVLWDPGSIIEVQPLFGPSWLPVFRSIGLPGNLPVVLTMIGLSLWFTNRQLVYGLFTVVLLGALVTSVFKVTIDLPRLHDPASLSKPQRPRHPFPVGMR